MDTQKQIAMEIAALHAALAEWLSGRCPRDGAFFQKEFRDRFHADFYNIQPAGKLLTRAGLLDALDNGYGRSQNFRIQVREVVVRHVHTATNTVLATYEEYQAGALNSDRTDNARFSTALIGRTDSGHLLWYGIHETWLPDDKHRTENFDF